MTLHFPSWDALQFALTSHLLPDDIVGQPGRVVVGPTSEIWFQPNTKDITKHMEALTPFGISVNGPMPTTTHHDVDHLWQAVPLIRANQDIAWTSNTPVLFVVHDHEQLTNFVNELLRLGTDRIGIRNHGDSFLAMVQGPPYYSLLPSLDRHEMNAPRAFVEQAPRFWVAIGWT